MTPFSLVLRKIRQDRGLLQREMSAILGVEQSYLSGLETAQKPAPQKSKLEYLIKKLELNFEDAELLRTAAKKSKNSFKLPPKMDLATWEMCHLFEKSLPNMSSIQLELITIALKLSPEKVEAPKM